VRQVYKQFGLWIQGAWRPARDGCSQPVLDPADETVLGEIPCASPQDLDDALAAAAESTRPWRATPAWERSTILRRIAIELKTRADGAAEFMSRETGKPIAEARGEMNAAIEQFDWYADEARRIFGHTLDGRDPNVRLNVRYDPVGPVAAFTAWNFPALLPARKIAAALAAGCTIILKPSEETPSSAYFIAAAAHAAGLPAGVLNIVTGNPAGIARHLIGSPIIRKVSLTGSARVGKELMQMSAEGMKKITMELGGHAPVLVFADADPIAAGDACARAKFRNAGQVCISPSRFYVHDSIYEAFAAAMVNTAQALRIGRGLDAGVEFGPMVNARGRDRAAALVEDALARGARLLAGGKIPAGFDRGFFYEPTILGSVPDQARIMHEEPFGPVAPLASFRDFDEVIARANSVPFGLAGYVFSRSLETAIRASEALEVGMVGVNDMLLAAAEIPFGGIKESGTGREGGRLGIFDYLEPKYVKLRLA